MLSEATTRLTDHFASLRSERESLGYPVYALEHGIEPSEIDALRDALSRELSKLRGLNNDHWIIWIIVAAEVGYAYDGDEYWHSFARAVPEWPRFGDRETIRQWFRKFAQTYTGFNPHGRWAQHFSIIAWPIAHAILPRDLQGQFARHLFDLRYDLAFQQDVTLTDIGARLRIGDRAGSSRFENLLEQTELTSRLVLALRDGNCSPWVTPRPATA